MVVKCFDEVAEEEIFLGLHNGVQHIGRAHY